MATHDKLNSETGCEENSNFCQLLKRLSIRDNQFNTWFQKKKFNYISSKVQNEKLRVNSHFQNKYNGDILFCKG